MIRHVIIIALSFSQMAVAAMTLKICGADSNTPYDCNLPIPIGTKLICYVDSNSAPTLWFGGVDMIGGDPGQPIGKLFGRGWDQTALDCNMSHFPAAGSRSRVVGWENQDQQSYELYADGQNIAAGQWFVLDYNATGVGHATIRLVEYSGCNTLVLCSYGLDQVANCDFNHDGGIDFFDFAKLAAYWLRADCNNSNHCNGIDINPVSDGKVDLKDLMYFAQSWLNPHLERAGGNSSLAMNMNSGFASMSLAAITNSAFTESAQTESVDTPQFLENVAPIYLSCDNTSPDPNQEVTVWVNTKKPLSFMEAGIYVIGDAEITAAMSEADCSNFGWDNGWQSDPYIDPNGWVFITGFRWNSDAVGTIGYIKLQYHSGTVGLYFDLSACLSGWVDQVNGKYGNVPFFSDTLYLNRDPNEF